MTAASDVTVTLPTRVTGGARHPVGRRRSLNYQANLDGLRAIAVILVMLYHGGVSWAHGGFLGVDIFFVLSGYLITTLLLVERSRWGAIDLRRFWIRRARRLLPALFLMLAVVGLCARFFTTPDRLPQLRGDGFATLSYVANWRFVLTRQSYFDQFAAPSPFRHMWSLGIEEQWYWLFPLLLLGLIALARRRRRRVAALLGMLAAVSAGWMAWLAWEGVDTSRVYYGTDTRVQELLAGSVLAVLTVAVRRSRPVRPARASTGLGPGETLAGAAGVLAVLVLATDTSGWLYRGGFLLFSVCVAVLLDGLRRAPSSLFSRALAWRPLVLVGVVSYGLYLWHWPVFLLLTPDRTQLAGPLLLALRFLVTGLIAAVSYRVIERPIRSGVLARRFAPATVRAIALASVGSVVVALLVGTAGAAPPPPIQSTGTFETRVVAPTIGQQSVLVVGDSPGRFLSWYLPRDVLSSYALSESTSIGCGLLPQTVVVGDTRTPTQSQCDDWPVEWQRAADEAKPNVVVLSTGFWELFDKEVDGSILRVGTPEWRASLLARLEEVRSVTTRGAVPLLVLNVPCFGQQDFVFQGLQLQNVVNDANRQQQVNAVLGEFSSRHPNDVTVLDDRSLLCPAGTYQPLVDGIDVRPDGVHAGGPGGRLVGEWLKPRLDAAIARAGAVRLLMVGDSVTWSLVEGYDPRATPGLRPWATTTLGCALDPYTEAVGSERYEPGPSCAAARAAWPAVAQAAHPQLALIMPGLAEMYDRVVNGEVVRLGTPAFEQALFAQFDAAIRNSGATRAALVTAPCRRLPDNGTDPQIGVMNDLGRLATLNDLVRAYVSRHPGVGLVDLDGYVCPHGYQDAMDGVVLRSDGMHFSPRGAALVWGWLGPRAAALAGTTGSGA